MVLSATDLINFLGCCHATFLARSPRNINGAVALAAPYLAPPPPPPAAAVVIIISIGRPDRPSSSVAPIRDSVKRTKIGDVGPQPHRRPVGSSGSVCSLPCALPASRTGNQREKG